ncbi:uncharacterized protein LOC105421291 [Amborella trichopoda]|uniref:uncharacterized protein LOC105421291 n=1 Tax=Amborella trichopoda TaxID=13333 RepID=UPI0005D420E6|nr:uncharacterized protein LOC105421291 [Amborella trichopoda]|eukprot:XP_011626460.1 uncharacterized protein LOC105421291 [Amborella trichopoda]
MQNKGLIVDNVIKRGKVLPNVCLLCKLDAETWPHLFLHCPFTFRIWCWYFDELDLAMVMPAEALGIISNLSAPLPKACLILWQMTRGLILWEVWKERNRRVFNGVSLPFANVFDNILRGLWLFCSVSKDRSDMLEVDFKRNLSILFRLDVFKSSSKGRWVPPLEGTFKLTFDRSSFGNPDPTDIGGVLRDWNGTVVFFYARPLGTKKPTMRRCRAFFMA